MSSHSKFTLSSSFLTHFFPFSIVWGAGSFELWSLKLGPYLNLYVAAGKSCTSLSSSGIHQHFFFPHYSQALPIWPDEGWPQWVLEEERWFSPQHTALWYFQYIWASTGCSYKSALVATHTKHRSQMHQSQSELMLLLFQPSLLCFSLLTSSES